MRYPIPAGGYPTSGTPLLTWPERTPSLLGGTPHWVPHADLARVPLSLDLARVPPSQDLALVPPPPPSGPGWGTPPQSGPGWGIPRVGPCRGNLPVVLSTRSVKARL